MSINRRYKNHPRPILLLAVAVLLLACVPCGLGPGEEALPGGAVEISPQAAQKLEQKLIAAIKENPSNHFTLHITEQEITSFLAFNLTAKEASPLSQPQVRFTRGKFFISGFLTGCPLRVRVLCIGSARAGDGHLEIALEKASIGPFAFPKNFLEVFSESLNESLREEQPGIQVTEVQILEGEIVLVGQK